jgi:predicted RND superfamily exporter protein
VRRRIFTALADAIQSYRKGFLLWIGLLFGISLYWLLTGHMSFNSSRNGLVNEDDPEQVRLMKFAERFGAANDLLIVLHGGDAAARRLVADGAAAELRANEQVKEIFYRIHFDPLAGANSHDTVGARGIYYLPLSRFQRLYDQLTMLKPWLKEQGGAGNRVAVKGIAFTLAELVKSFKALEVNDFTFKGPPALASLKGKDVEAAVLGVVDGLKELHRFIDDPNHTRIEMKGEHFADAAMGVALDAGGYVVSADAEKSLHIMRLSGNGDMVDAKSSYPLIAKVREVLKRHVAKAKKQTGSEVRWGLTGIPALVVDEKEIADRDIPKTGVISLIGCLVVFLVSFRSFRAMGVAFLPLVVGITCALALFSILVGSLSLLTSPTAVILIGMGIDFSIHLYTRIRDEREAGADPAQAARIGLSGTGPAIWTGGLTSAAAFAALAVTDFRATHELGVLAATGLIIVLLITLILVPLVMGRPGAKHKRRKTASNTLSKGPPKWALNVHSRTSAGVVLAVMVALTVGLALTIRPIEFNFDISSYMPPSAPSIKVIDLLKKHGVVSTEYAVVQARSIEEVNRQTRELRQMKAEHGRIAKVESIVQLMPKKLGPKEEILQELRQLGLPRVQVNASDAPTGATFVSALATLSEKDWLTDVVQPIREMLRLSASELSQAPFVALHEEVKKLHKRAKALQKTESAALEQRIVQFDKQAAALVATLDSFIHDGRVGFLPSDLPASMRGAYYRKEKDGSEYFATRVYPQVDIADPTEIRKFRADLEMVDKDATGYAIVYSHFALLMQGAFRDGAIWAGFIVLFLVLLDLRSIRDALYALFPLVMGGIWMIGLINVLGIDYTFANVIAIPLILGIGIDSGIHLVHRWRETDGQVWLSLSRTGKAILISSLTTIVAFGSLGFGEHRGGASLGHVLCLGVASCMLTALIALPALLTVTGSKPDPKYVHNTEESSEPLV